MLLGTATVSVRFSVYIEQSVSESDHARRWLWAWGGRCAVGGMVMVSYECVVRCGPMYSNVLWCWIRLLSHPTIYEENDVRMSSVFCKVLQR